MAECPVPHEARGGAADEACPVIHKITTHHPEGLNADGQSSASASSTSSDSAAAAAATSGSSSTSSTAGSNAVAVTLRDVDIDAIDATPSALEYRKLRRVMAQITKFYRAGSEAKARNVAAVDAELAKLAVDEAMVAAQIAALQPQQSQPPATDKDDKDEGDDDDGAAAAAAALDLRARQFRVHPKAQDYLRDLRAEEEAMAKTRADYEKQRAEFVDVFEWSKGVVSCCEWLEKFLGSYCKATMDLPKKIADAIEEPEELSEDLRGAYAKALDEITYNLAESQDFFQASVDGRLKRYHGIELDIILAQRKALEAFPEDSPRRMYIEAELDKDLQYLAENMRDTPDVMKRRHQMLQNHIDFFKALKYPRDKLRVLRLDDSFDRQYDSKYDLYATPDDARVAEESAAAVKAAEEAAEADAGKEGEGEGESAKAEA